MSVRVRAAVVMMLVLSGPRVAVVWGQELGGAGTVQGTVTDQSGGVMQAVDVKISNPVSGLTRTE